MISVLFELEQVEFGMLIPSIPLPESFKGNATQDNCKRTTVCLLEFGRVSSQ